MADKRLRQDLKFSDLFFANMGGIIGSGWLFGSLYAANIAGPSSILSWFFAGIGMLVLAMVYAELGGMLPKPGALVRYPQFTHGTLASFIMSWSVWIAYATVAPLEAEAATQYASYYDHALVQGNSLSAWGLFVAALLTIVFFVLNYFGIRLMANVNRVVTILKIAVPVLTIIVLLITGMHPKNFTGYGGFTLGGSGGVLYAIAAAGIALSYTGFRQAIDLAGEARNPARDVPRAVLLSILITIVIYTLLEVVFVGGLTPSELSVGWLKLNLSSPFANVAAALNLGWLVTILMGDAILSPSGTGIVSTASTSRVVMAMVDNNYLPAKLGLTNERYKVPRPALWVNLAAGIAFVLMYQGWSSLVAIVSSSTILTYIFGPISATVLRKTGQHIPRSYSVRGMKVLAPLGFIVASLIIYWSGWPLIGQLLIVIAVGLLVYAYYFLKNKFPKEHLRSSAWLVLYLVFMGAVSKLGSFGSGAKVLPFPLDTIIVALGSLIFFYVGVASRLDIPKDSALWSEFFGANGEFVTSTPTYSATVSQTTNVE